MKRLSSLIVATLLMLGLANMSTAHDHDKKEFSKYQKAQRHALEQNQKAEKEFLKATHYSTSGLSHEQKVERHNLKEQQKIEKENFKHHRL